MGFVLALVTAALSVALGGWIYLRHRDWVVGAVAVCLGASSVAIWSIGAANETELEAEILNARERIAVLEATPSRRGFTDEARAKMVLALSEFVGPTAYVVANATDLDTTEYAREIASILKDAGWNVPASFGMTYAPLVLPGHERMPGGVVFGVSAEVPEKFAASVFTVLREAGVDIVRGAHWPGTEHPISILVGQQKGP